MHRIPMHHLQMSRWSLLVALLFQVSFLGWPIPVLELSKIDELAPPDVLDQGSSQLIKEGDPNSHTELYKKLLKAQLIEGGLSETKADLVAEKEKWTIRHRDGRPAEKNLRENWIRLITDEMIQRAVSSLPHYILNDGLVS